MSGPRLITADTLCAAAETVLRDQLADLVEALGYAERLKPVADWQQLPVQAAIVTASLPAVGISSPGLVGRPTRSASSGWSATWRINVGIYDRGFDHHDTAARARDWAALVRAVLVESRTLGGVASAVTWATEEYALYPQKEVARTFGAASVGVDVSATDVLNLTTLNRPVLRAEPTSLVHH